MASRPSYERASIAKVLEDGTAADVIELFGSFKSATGNAQQSQQQPNAQDAKAAAQAAINKAKTEPPASLSDIPGGKPRLATDSRPSPQWIRHPCRTPCADEPRSGRGIPEPEHVRELPHDRKQNHHALR
ncbi:hypothetical protein MNU23_30785 [Pseudomonas aeruginosa]|uniref:hypothetical protein n=1 Tax=Pseudomonas aeruginosa TaxID=287 RepID=UPI0021A83841|nr:hypothetical protein [Pseudomonas aeruginosa]MCT2416065.1 hypothetical protein [Pseudomonas aeruginosa]